MHYVNDQHNVPDKELGCGTAIFIVTPLRVSQLNVFFTFAEAIVALQLLTCCVRVNVGCRTEIDPEGQMAEVAGGYTCI